MDLKNVVACGRTSANIYIVIYNLLLAAWLKMELRDLGISAIDSGLVEKLSGDNSKDEKQRVMVLFKTGYMNTFVI